MQDTRDVATDLDGGFVLNDMKFCLKNTPDSAAQIKTKPLLNSDETNKGGRPRIHATRAERNAAYYQGQKRKHQVHIPALPPGPYRILYADPPWQYENDGMRKYGNAAFHYPT